MGATIYIRARENKHQTIVIMKSSILILIGLVSSVRSYQTSRLVSRQRPFQIVTFATIESTTRSSSHNTNAENNNNIEMIHTTLDSILPVETTDHHHHHPHHNGKKQNKALHDIEFLRKRTCDLLKLTEYCVAGSSEPTQVVIDHNSLGRHMKVEKKTFHFLMDGWALSGEPDAIEQSRQLLQRMEDLGKFYKLSAGSTNKKLQPDVRSYTKFINTIGRNGDVNAGHEAEAVLLKMKDLYQQHVNSDPELASSIKPNSYTFTAVIQAHCNANTLESAERAAELTERMVDKYQRGDPDVTPNYKAFNHAIRAFGKQGQADRAEQIFSRMESLYRSGIPEAKPRIINYNALISAWAHCRWEGSAQRAEQVLDRMQSNNIEPTTVSFNAVLDAFAKSGDADAAEKAQELLQKMERTSKPNTRSFNSVINAWAKSRHVDAASRAQDLLDLMERRFEEGDRDVRPDAHSFCTVINAYARSTLPDKAERAYWLYQEMQKLYSLGNKSVRPNVVACNAVLNACAFTVGEHADQTRAVEIAHSILQDMKHSEFMRPDQVTYGTFLKVIATHMADSRNQRQIVEILLKKCIQDGQMGNLVLQQLRVMSEPDHYHQLIGSSIDDEIRMEDLPKQWWRNVVEGKWRRRRTLS